MFAGFIKFLLRTKRRAPTPGSAESIDPEPLFSRKPPIIDPSFDDCSGDYPPDWEARRQAVLGRDGFRCQATGCIESGNQLQVHHIKAKGEGGTHSLKNLVSLCPVHHAIIHIATHALKYNDPRYQIISRHWRNGFEVRCNVRRFIRISPGDLKIVRSHFIPKCHWCQNTDWRGAFRKKTLWKHEIIWTHCPTCNARWELEPGLREETATQIIHAFPATQNERSFYFSPVLISGLMKPVAYKGCKVCASHNRDGWLVERTGKHGRFLGCSKYPACAYTEDFR